MLMLSLLPGVTVVGYGTEAAGDFSVLKNSVRVDIVTGKASTGAIWCHGIRSFPFFCIDGNASVGLLMDIENAIAGEEYD